MSRSGFHPLSMPQFTAPSSGPPLSYVAPPFYTSAQSMTVPQPASPVSRTSAAENRSGDSQRQPPLTVPSSLPQRLPPPPPPPVSHVKPPSPFHPSSPAGIRPVFSSAPSIVPPTSSLSSPSALAPPSVFTSSSYPFFPPVSMARTANHGHSSNSTGFANSFLAPSPPTVAGPLPPQPKYTSLGVPMAFGDQPYALTRPPFSTASFTPINSTKPATLAAETAPLTTSRPSSRTSNSSTSSFNNDSNRPGSLPFPGHSSSSSTRSPSLPPPLAPSTFSSPGSESSVCLIFRPHLVFFMQPL